MTTAIRSAEAIALDPQPGDIYEGSWGYDQTNAEFWQVVKRTAQTVTLRRLSMTAVGEGHSTRLMPLPDEFYTEPAGWVSRVNGHLMIEAGDLVYDPSPRFVEKRCSLRKDEKPGAWLRMASYYGVHPWDGGSAYDTLAAGYEGH